MRWTRAATLLLALVVQTTVLPHVLPGQFTPDLMLVAAVVIGLHVEQREAVVWGAFAGLLLDLLAGRFIGFNLAMKGAAAFAASVVGLKLYRRNIGVPAALGALATLVQELLMYVILILSGLDIEFRSAFSAIIAPHVVFNAVFAALVNMVMFRIVVGLGGRLPEQ